MAIEGVDLDFTPPALRELARQAISKGTGARALRGLMEKVMLEVMYEIPGDGEKNGPIDITLPVITGKENAKRKSKTKKPKTKKLKTKKPDKKKPESRRAA